MQVSFDSIWRIMLKASEVPEDFRAPPPPGQWYDRLSQDLRRRQIYALNKQMKAVDDFRWGIYSKQQNARMIALAKCVAIRQRHLRAAGLRQLTERTQALAAERKRQQALTLADTLERAGLEPDDAPLLETMPTSLNEQLLPIYHCPLHQTVQGCSRPDCPLLHTIIPTEQVSWRLRWWALDCGHGGWVGETSAVQSGTSVWPEMRLSASAFPSAAVPRGGSRAGSGASSPALPWASLPPPLPSPAAADESAGDDDAGEVTEEANEEPAESDEGLDRFFGANFGRTSKDGAKAAEEWASADATTLGAAASVEEAVAAQHTSLGATAASPSRGVVTATGGAQRQQSPLANHFHEQQPQSRPVYMPAATVTVAAAIDVVGSESSSAAPSQRSARVSTMSEVESEMARLEARISRLWVPAARKAAQATTIPNRATASVSSISTFGGHDASPAHGRRTASTASLPSVDREPGALAGEASRGGVAAGGGARLALKASVPPDAELARLEAKIARLCSRPPPTARQVQASGALEVERQRIRQRSTSAAAAGATFVTAR